MANGKWQMADGNATPHLDTHVAQVITVKSLDQ